MVSKIGLFSAIGFFIINFTALHTLIPGIKYIRPGLLLTIVLTALILPKLKTANWYKPLGKWRFIFWLTIIPGIFFGYGTGRVRSCLTTNLQDFIGSFLAITIFIDTIDKLRIFNKVIISSSMVLAIYVLLHGGQGPGIIIDENDVGLVLVMLLPFAYFNIACAKNSFVKTTLLSILLFVLLAIATTFSRGAMVGVLPTLLIMWFQSKRKIPTLIGIVILLSAVIAWGPPGLIEEFKTIGDTSEGTANSRRYFWELSIELFKKKPVFGVGASCWGNAVWSGLIFLPRHVSNTTPHSVYFQLISELGVFGIIAWLSLMISTFAVGISILKHFKYLLANTNDLTAKTDIQFIVIFTTSLLIGLIGGLICGVFLSYLFYPQLYTYVAIMQATYLLSIQVSATLTNNSIIETDQL